MNLTEAIAHGSANPVLLFAMALLLGALHGLEPGHSKTMMAAYIIAIKGTVFQAVLLGVSAAASHVVIVWVLAILGLKYGNELIGEDLEPVLMMVSGAIIVGIAIWVFTQAWRDSRKKAARGHGHEHHNHDHSHAHEHAHSHHDASHAHNHSHDHHNHDFDGMDAHARAHARDIEKRVGSDRTSTVQTILFGLSGGLIPCPAAITVLLLCLQLKKMALGLTLVTAFSIGLAATLVAVGVVAAVGIRYAAHRTPWLDRALARAPFISAVLIGLLGLIMIISGATHGPHN
ncbi:nickel/cobalt efflux transporter [uncultured Roseibium sp.]|uniref:nickel/cobalt efflux transporter n=1 Tax=uncultured Roseibium sp. TaxID=1936171 RepID=UPI003218021D